MHESTGSLKLFGETPMTGMEQIVRQPVLPVIVIDDAASAVPLAEALLAGGITSIEITFRTQAAAAAISAIRKDLPEMTVGAGTVLRLEQAKAAIDAGIQFALSPGLNPAIVEYFANAGLPFIPGVMTPSEIDRAAEMGCKYIKFFPAGTAGGPAALKAMNAPFKHLGLRYCPTGGVSVDNMDKYLALPEVFAVGGSWLATRDQISQGKWTEISEQAKAALTVATRAKQQI